MSEKFTEADIYGTANNDVIVDGHFIPTEEGGFSSDAGEICKCKTREEHIEHIRRDFPYDMYIYFKQNMNIDNEKED